MTLRTDGVYDTGFRGSSSNIFAFDTRYNQSVDVTYNGKTPDSRGHLFIQGYYVQDVDALNNPSPFSNLNAVAARTTMDYNRRQLDIEGIRFQPSYKIISSNEFLVGADWERTWITSTRARAGGAAVTQLSPQDNNETDQVWAFYAEDAQTFFDRWIIRGGVRQTYGTTTTLQTPFAATLVPSSVNYSATTYTLGSTLQITDWLTARVGASSGFRAPTATELGSNFTTTPIGTTIFGNSSLSPETSQQVELGGTITTKDARLDLVVFQNVIGNRINAQTISSVGGVVIQQYQNNPANIVVQGIEMQGEADVHRTLGLPVAPGTRWTVFSNGYYNWQMTDFGEVVATAGTSQAVRMYQYEATIGTRYGQLDSAMPWNVQLIGQLRGPMWYNTEEALNTQLFPGQVRNVTAYRKDPFWVWSTRAEVEFAKGLKFYAALNNIFDINNSPQFIGLDQVPCGDKPGGAERLVRQFDAWARVHHRRAVQVLMQRLAAFLACALGLVPGARAEPLIVHDALDRTVSFAAPPQRIIPIFASNTEIVTALGLAGRVVGIEAYTRYPPEILDRPLVGGRLGFSVDAVVDLHPDLVVVTPSRQAANQLVDPMERLGIPIIVLLQRDVAEILSNIRLVARIAGISAAR